MSYSLLEWFSVISLILNFSPLLLIKAGLNRLKLIKATGWHKFNLSRLFSNPGWHIHHWKETYLRINVPIFYGANGYADCSRRKRVWYGLTHRAERSGNQTL